ncbi:MAG: aminotransferase class I/II-fold pyridoxal phosphate-dependent enzyme [Gammaproteobacteria bacterium]|nr:MAG: aminotransferase class I/II-fold pyridoxal phosphate-dependent enzyme [Gammaproteobacteria bacterium]
MTRLADLDDEALNALAERLEAELELVSGNRLSLDLTRGKPDAEQLDLSNGLEQAIDGNYIASDGTDTRNYGGIRGIPEARNLGAEIMEVPAEHIICWGNSSLSLMYLSVDLLMESGIWGDERRWGKAEAPKLLTPVPGYDRHFVLSERLGLGMINVALTDAGPDMDAVRELVGNDADIKGIWCVPKYSNPTGCTYSDEVVAQMAELPKVAAADDFVVLWDNAYAVHDFQFPRKPLANLLELAERAGTADHVLLFASTSKITHASGGLGFVAGSPATLNALESRLSASSVGPDKVNQLRHARFLGGRVEAHMANHAAIVKPKFDVVGQVLEEELGHLGIAEWTTPEGGYFVSLDVRPGLAGTIGKLAADIGLALTPAGATFPYKDDPEDRNLRIAPTFAKLEDIKTAMEVLVLCVKIATIRDEISKR